MIAEILNYLRDLSQNNNREWFNANKGRYNELKEAHTGIIQEIIDRLSKNDSELAHLQAKDCLFRIHRDIRFSPNKLPYKTYFGAYICAGGGRKSPRSGYYLHLEPDNCLLSGGLWMPEPKLLRRLRQDIYDHIDEFLGILERPSFKAVYPGLDGEMLKRVPSNFPFNFEYEHLLRYKDYCITTKKPDSFFDDPEWISHAIDIFSLQIPFHRFLNYTVDELNGKK
ncbi:MAG: DUF2461 domain-containing protein [Tannerellaceae bacterium]|nr:DUF2461 domain-containing protein [Tannerellaceae bacterium]